jgi:serine/threonine protein kinase/tetratricopeptide (TPR) repeat protein
MLVDELNRDLLVAVLALLTGAVPRPGLAAALNAWSKDRKQSLAQRLLGEGALDGDCLRALECLASSHLTRYHNDLRLCLDAWNAQELTLEVLTEIGDNALQSTLGMTALGGPAIATATAPVSPESQETAPVGEGAQSPGSGEPPRSTQGERFVPIRPHARGGIGQVWLARDCELQRHVALKVIQPRFADREDQRARFLIEAEITGNLEHPGIVPVYSLGRNADGRPYYAMRFIRGESLSAAIRAFHRPSDREARLAGGRERSMWGIAFRQLLGRFLDVCDAMDYAHSRCVIHRDLKPANIMLGRFGETLVVDWGMAKVIGKVDLLPARPEEDFEPSLAGSDTRTLSGDTQPGTRIGTPAYMSPEQARGSIDELGPASDVYSLGATLYELLTGRVAFTGDTVLDVIERVREGDFPPPRAVQRSLPAPLEGICLKAMALRPEDRYGSVRELARDLEHWLADEPVAAYRERPLERVGRWLRQHRTWTYAVGAALVGISLAATIGVVVVEAGRRREAEARALAQTNFQLANRAVRDYLTNVSQNTLLKEQDSVDLRGLRRELLETALRYYKDFVKQRSDDPQLRQELAEAHFRVGEIAREIGSTSEAIASFDAARTIWTELAATAPEEPAIQGHLADCHLAIGEQLAADNQFQAATAALDRARAILQPLARRHPDVVAYQLSLADCYTARGHARAELGFPDQGLESLERAKEILRALLARDPKDAEYNKKLAGTINVQGFVHYKQRDYPAALRSFEEVQGICQSQLEEITSGPKPVQLLNSLALGHYNIATIELENDRLDAALAAFERSLEYRSALVAAHPSVIQFQLNLATSSGEIALLQHKARQDSKAFASIRESIDILERLVRAQPDQSRFRAGLGRSWNILGSLHDEARENELAVPALVRAVKEEEQAMGEAPEVEQYKIYSINHLDNLGEQFIDLGRAADGLPYYRRAIDLRQGLLDAHPRDRDRSLDLAAALSTLGTIQRHAGESAAARQSFARAGDVLAAVADAAPADSALQGRLGAVFTGEALALADLGQVSKAVPVLRRAVAILKPFGASSNEDDPARGWLGESLWELGRLLRAAGSPAEADVLDAERLILWKDRAPRELARLALQETDRAALIGYAKTPISEPARLVRDRDLDQAADNLRMAVSLGFRDLAMLRADPESWLLLSRADLRLLIDDLEFPDQPFDLQPRKPQ